MRNYVKAEFYKLSRRKYPWVVLGVALFLESLLMLGFLLIGSSRIVFYDGMTNLLPLLALGLKGMIGKGRRSAEVVQAIREHGAVYFITIGGAAALLAEAVKKKTPVCYEDLGPEAICRLEVENFYAIVGIDSRGNTIIR